MFWKITHLRPPVSTHPVAFGAGYTNRRNAALGFFRGSTRATAAPRKIRAQRRDRRHRIHPKRPHLLVNTDRPMIQPRLLQRRRRPIHRRPSSDRIESVSWEIPCSIENVVTAPRGASTGMRASVRTKRCRSIRDLLIHNCQRCPET